jgi:hypothetical protein
MFEALAPGQYLIAVVSDYIDEELSQDSFLDALAAAAVPITVPVGRDVTQDLTIGSSTQ